MIANDRSFSLVPFPSRKGISTFSSNTNDVSFFSFFLSRNVEMMQQPIPITDKTISSVAAIKCLLSMNQWNAYRSNSLTLVSSAMVDVRSSVYVTRRVHTDRYSVTETIGIYVRNVPTWNPVPLFRMMEWSTFCQQIRESDFFPSENNRKKRIFFLRSY